MTHAYTHTPNALDGERWFRALNPETETEGIWHEGPTRAGKTWPAGPGRCGYTAPVIDFDWLETSLSIGTATVNVCPICLASLRADYERARS